MSEKLYLYPGWLRVWHGINALLCLALIISGTSMQYSAMSTTILRFDMAVTIHNVCGIALSFNYLIFLFGNLFTQNGVYYRFKVLKLFKQLPVQLKYYLSGIFKHEKVPFPTTAESKFNPLQKITYITIMYIFVPLVFVSGWAMLFPEIIIKEIFGLSGLFLTDIVHIVAGFAISFFLIVHLYFCTVGATAVSNFKSMINGWHEPHD
jgi:thiosulfate reductase cytochrome b subunit